MTGPARWWRPAAVRPTGSSASPEQRYARAERPRQHQPGADAEAGRTPGRSLLQRQGEQRAHGPLDQQEAEGAGGQTTEQDAEEDTDHPGRGIAEPDLQDDPEHDRSPGPVRRRTRRRAAAVGKGRRVARRRSVVGSRRASAGRGRRCDSRYTSRTARWRPDTRRRRSATSGCRGGSGPSPGRCPGRRTDTRRWSPRPTRWPVSTTACCGWPGDRRRPERPPGDRHTRDGSRAAPAPRPACSRAGRANVRLRLWPSS